MIRSLEEKNLVLEEEAAKLRRGCFKERERGVATVGVLRLASR